MLRRVAVLLLAAFSTTAAATTCERLQDRGLDYTDSNGCGGCCAHRTIAACASNGCEPYYEQCCPGLDGSVAQGWMRRFLGDVASDEDASGDMASGDVASGDEPLPPSPPPPSPPLPTLPLPSPPPSPTTPPPPSPPLPSAPPIPSPAAPPARHVISGGFTLGGSSPDDYDAAARTSIKTMLATAANVSTDAVSLTLTAGSVIVTFTIGLTTATDAEAARGSLVAGPLATPAALETALTDQFAADGVTTAPPVEVQALTEPVVEDADDDGASFPVALVAAIGGGVVAAFAGIAIVIYIRKKRASDTPQFEVRDLQRQDV